MSRIMIFFLHEGLLIMLVLPLRVKNVQRGWREEMRAKRKKQWAIICLSLGLEIMLAASRWRVRPQRLKPGGRGG
jgi:hypothetical protein